MRGDRKHHPAETGYLQQEVPALGIGDVTYRDEIGDNAVEVEWRAHDQKSFRPSEAGEFDSRSAPHVATSAVRADQPAAGPPLGASVALDRNLHPRSMLDHVFDARVELQLELCFGAELLLQDARQLGLFALHPIGMIGRVGDGSKSNCASTPWRLLRYWNCGAIKPCAISAAAAPSR